MSSFVLCFWPVFSSSRSFAARFFTFLLWAVKRLFFSFDVALDLLVGVFEALLDISEDNVDEKDCEVEDEISLPLALDCRFTPYRLSAIPTCDADSLIWVIMSLAKTLLYLSVFVGVWWKQHMRKAEWTAKTGIDKGKFSEHTYHLWPSHISSLSLWRTTNVVIFLYALSRPCMFLGRQQWGPFGNYHEHKAEPLADCSCWQDGYCAVEFPLWTFQSSIKNGYSIIVSAIPRGAWDASFQVYKSARIACKVLTPAEHNRTSEHTIWSTTKQTHYTTTNQDAFE